MRETTMRRRDLLAGATGIAAAGLLPAGQSAAQPMPRFPAGFVWGSATSSYQVEGAVDVDGRAPSIWDTFTRQPGRIADGTNGDVAVDHYRRWPEDVALMARAGFDAYRFSIAWPRVIPQGTGAVNPKGLDVYDRLVDGLLAARIEPWVCLYHWDLPQALEDRGGWHDRDIAGWFTDYARVVVARLGDRVKHWPLINEPNVHAIFGHGFGNHAPGRTGWASYCAAQHHQNLATGMALDAIRADRPCLTLGTIVSMQPVHVAGPNPTDADRAARDRFDAAWNRCNLDPMVHGRYPAVFERDFAPFVREGDMATIRRPLDFVGVNYYGGAFVLDDPNGFIGGAGFGPLPAGTQVTALGWPIVPHGMVEVLVDLKDNYGAPPVYIMENGACYDDPAPAGGLVADPERTAYFRAHLLAAREAIARGCDLRGYFAWSLLDNFEWAEGLRRRFGIVHVDFETQVRTPKSSFHVLAEAIRASR
jgi:beta-glucosidase